MHEEEKINQLANTLFSKGLAASMWDAKNKAKDPNAEEKLPKLAYNLYNNPFNPKFISFLDPKDGYPLIIPCFQLRAPDRSKLIFPYSHFKEELDKELERRGRADRYAQGIQRRMGGLYRIYGCRYFYEFIADRVAPRRISE